MKKSLLFNKDEVNTQRQAFLDLAKAIIIIVMIVDHTFMYGGAEMNEGLIRAFDYILAGSLGAPVFMTCMGIGMAYSRRSDAASMARRGLRLLIVSYILNLVRGFAPLLGWVITGDRGMLVLFSYALTLVDILQLAGLSFLLMALLRRMKVSMGWILCLSLVMSLAGSLVADGSGWLVERTHTGIVAVDAIIALFVGTITPAVGSESGIIPLYVFSCFPLLNWFVFVAFGYWGGKLIRRCGDLDRLFAWTTPVSALMFITLSIIAWSGDTFMKIYTIEEGFYYMNIVDMFLITMPGIVMVFGVCHYICRRFAGITATGEGGKRWFELVRRTSMDLNRIYLTQWIIIIYAIAAPINLIFEKSMSIVQLLMSAMVIIVLSIWLARKKPMSLIKL